MEKKLRELFDTIFENRMRRAIALTLAIIVTFTTTYALVLPAITLEKDTAETMPGVSMGGNEQDGDTSTSSDEEDSDESGLDGSNADTVAFDAEAKNEDGETETLVHVEADADAFPEGTTMEARAVTDPDVIDSITQTTEGEVVAVHAVDLTFTDENGETVQPAEGSQVSVTLSAGEGETSDADNEGTDVDSEESAADSEGLTSEESVSKPDDQTVESGEEEAAEEQNAEKQATETTVVQYTEDNGAEAVETNDDVSFQVEPETDLDQDSAVSFDMSEQTGEEDSQTYAIVETVAEDEGEEEEAPDEAVPGSVGGAGAEAEEAVPEEQAVPLEEQLAEAEEGVLTAEDASYFITVSYGPEAEIPRGASLKVEEILSEEPAYEEHLDATQNALNEAAQTETTEANGVYAGPVVEEEPQFVTLQSLTADPEAADPEQAKAVPEPAPEPEIVYARFFDITILDADGDEVTPAAPVKVSIELLDTEQDEQVIQNADAAQVIHFGEDEPELVEAEVLEDAAAGVTFDTEGFSVYGVVYTIDFHFGEYSYSIQGGSSISLSELFRLLGMSCDVSDVESVSFSDEGLVKVIQITEDTTAGQLKEQHGLAPEYSGETTEEQIAEWDAKAYAAPDWVLFSLKAFITQESLTVTMKDGEQIVIRVTDAQIGTNVLTSDGKTFTITVTYDDDAEIPDGSYLEAEEVLSDSERYKGLLSDSAAALGTQEEDIGHIRFFNITIRNGEEIIEPKKAVTVDIHYVDPVSLDEAQDFDVIHFGHDGTEVLPPAVTVDVENQTAQEFVFQTESFSTFAITSIPSQISDLVDKEFVLFIQPGNQGAVLSPESHPSYNNRLRAIPATSTGTRITADDVDTLPVWKITNGSQNGTYRLSTTYNNQTVYINFDNQNGGDRNGHLWVSTTPQDLRIRTRNGPNGGTQFRFTYNTDSNAVSLDLFGGNPSNGFSVYNGGDNNNNEYFTLYEIGEPIQRKVTVHFVDRKGTPLTGVQYTGTNSYVTRNEDGTFTILNDWHGTTGTISLENDFGLSRYTYANTHLAKNTEVEWPTAQHGYTYDGIIIEPTFQSTGHALQYRTEYGDSDTQPNNNYGWYDFSEAFSAYIPPYGDLSEYAAAGDQNVYVIMDPYPAVSSTGGSSTGGSSTGGGSGNNSPSNTDPVFHKDLVNNYDGTYELSLSVVGKALNESETPKVNVLLVVDTSSSMTSNYVNYVNDNGQTVNGTRLEATQVQLRKLGSELLGRNNLQNGDTDDDDIVQIAMVTFDGKTHPDTLDWTENYSTYQSAVNGLQTHRGTNWEDALDAALVKAQAMKNAQPGEQVYVLFFTDGEPSQYRNFCGINDADHPYGYRYFFAMFGKEASKDEARAIVSTSGIQLYTMFAFGPTGNNQPTYNGKTQFDLLHDLTKYAYNAPDSSDLEDTYAFNATDSSKLNDAFDEILRQFSSTLAVSDVTMNDSFTNLTVAGINTPSNGSTGGFRYWKIPAGGTWENKMAWSEAPAATIDQSGSVQWNLQGVTLENDVTYVVTFTVWPSQDAYDWVADLKNGVRTWEEADAAGLADTVLFRSGNETDGYTYEVQTNPQSTVPTDGTVGTNGVSYKKTTTETVNERGQDEGTTTHTTEDPNSYVKETITYTRNEDGTWTKTTVSEVITAFNMPDKRMDLTNTDFHVDKFWDVNGKLTELHNFLYHQDDDENWVSNEKKINFKISKGYDDDGKPIPYDKYGTDGLNLGWQAGEDEYDWVGETTTINGHTIGTRWREKLDISFGLILTKDTFEARGLDPSDSRYLHTTFQGEEYYILKGDYGWDYAIDEVIGLNYQFDFRSSVYHPMLIDGSPAHVKFTVDNGVWTITEMEKDLTALTGNNILRGDLRVQKELLDVDGNRRNDDTTTFEFTVKLVNPDYVFIPDEGVETVPWYGVSKTTEENGQTVTQYYFYQYAPGGVFDHYATEAEATHYDSETHSLVLNEGYVGNMMQPGGTHDTVTYNGVSYTGYTEASATIHVKAEEDWSIANIPLGTVVTVSEPDKPGYTFVNAKLNNGVIETTTSEGTHTTVGTTIPAGQTSTIKITNRELPISLTIFKADKDSHNVLLDGAEFKLTKWNGSTWVNVSGFENAFSVAQTTGYTIQNIQPGLYRLHETKIPEGYIVTQDTYFKVENRQIFLCDEAGNTTTGSGEDAVPYVNEMAEIGSTDNNAQIELTVYNILCVALPSTGGPGTKMIYLSGIMLIGLAGAGYGMNLRRRNDE